MIQRIRADHPEADEANLQANALANLAWFYIALYDGQYTAGPTPRRKPQRRPGFSPGQGGFY